MMILLASAGSCYSGVLASAAEPVPATPQSSFTENTIIIIGLGLLGLMAKLAGSISQIKKSGREFVREEMTLAGADAQSGKMPQPLVTQRHDGTVQKSEFAQHRTSVADSIAELKTDIHDLRIADRETAEKLTGEMQKLALIIGELRGEVAALTRKK